MAEQGTDSRTVRGITEHKCVNGIAELLIAEPSQDAESVWAGVDVITEDEKGWWLFPHESKGLGGGRSHLDFKACLCEMIAEVLPST